MGNVSSGGARFIAWTIGLATVGVAVYILGCVCVYPPPPPPPPCKEIVNDLRTLWSYERDYAYRHKSLAASIGEMGDGAGIGKEGFVLKPSLWEARLDGDGQRRAASYRITIAKTGQKVSVGAYRFGIFPAYGNTGEREPFSAILVAVSERPSNDDVCFVALCGPVKLQNDFSFDLEWPVFKLQADAAVVKALREPGKTTLASLKERLERGDLRHFVQGSFGGLYYPQSE